MTIQELQDKNLKHGIYHKATWQSIKVANDITYTKVSNGVVRIVKYANTKYAIAKHSEKAPMVEKSENTKKEWIVEDLLFYNTNTKNYLVSLGTTGIKPHSKYYANGEEIDKETYNTLFPPKTNESPVFNVKLENLISID